MKKTFGLLAGAVLALGLVSAASAADLPKRNVAPVAVPAFVQVDPNAVTGAYVGVRGGYATQAEDFTFGGNVGYDFGYVRLEADYDRFNDTKGNLFTGNAIVEYSLANGFTPYVLAGAGVATVGDVFKSGSFDNRLAVYNVGAGVRYDLGVIGAKGFEADARYRFIDTIENRGTDGEHLFTVGLNYKFNQ